MIGLTKPRAQAAQLRFREVPRTIGGQWLWHSHHAKRFQTANRFVCTCIFFPPVHRHDPVATAQSNSKMASGNCYPSCPMCFPKSGADISVHLFVNSTGSALSSHSMLMKSKTSAWAIARHMEGGYSFKGAVLN